MAGESMREEVGKVDEEPNHQHLEPLLEVSTVATGPPTSEQVVEGKPVEDSEPGVHIVA